MVLSLDAENFIVSLVCLFLLCSTQIKIMSYSHFVCSEHCNKIILVFVKERTFFSVLISCSLGFFNNNIQQSEVR